MKTVIRITLGNDEEITINQQMNEEFQRLLTFLREQGIDIEPANAVPGSCVNPMFLCG